MPESADWYNSTYIMVWGSNVPQTRTPDAHFFTEVRYKGTKTVAVTPDYSEVAKLADIWLHPKQGTDAAVAMAMGHVILKEFYFGGNGQPRSAYFDDYVRRYTDMPMLVLLKEHAPTARPCWCPTATCARRTSTTSSARPTTRNGRRSPSTSSGKVVLPNGAIGFRWGPDGRADAGQWNLEAKEARHGHDVEAAALAARRRRAERRARQGRLPVLRRHRARALPEQRAGQAPHDVLVRTVPVQRIALGRTATSARPGRDRVRPAGGATTASPAACGGELAATSYDDDTPYTPAWQEKHHRRAARPGDPRRARVRRERREDATARSMVIIGAAMNHWYHSDMNYRGIINMLMMCGCIGKSGGGWAHYVGQEKLRPQTGWTALAFALDWIRPPRQMNGTSFFYAHTDQWRYEKLGVDEVLSPLADKTRYGGSMIDYNVRAERMGWLPSAPQLQTQSAAGGARRRRPPGMEPKDYAVKPLQDGALKLALRRPGPPGQLAAQHVRLALEHPRLVGQGPRVLPQAPARHAATACRARTSAARTPSPSEVVWHEQAPEGKLDLLVDARLPHEHDLPLLRHRAADRDLVREERPQHQRHAPVHPSAVDRGGSGLGIARATGRSTRASRRSSARSASAISASSSDLVLTPLMHDTPGELAQPFDVKDWKRGECELIPGKTAP